MGRLNSLLNNDLQNRYSTNVNVQKRVGISVAAGTFVLIIIQFCKHMLILGEGLSYTLQLSSIWLVGLFGLLALWTGIHRNKVTQIIQVLLPLFMSIAMAVDAESGNFSSIVFVGIGFFLAMEYGYVQNYVWLKTIILGVIYIIAVIYGFTIEKSMSWIVALHNLTGTVIVLYLAGILISVQVEKQRNRRAELEREVRVRTKDLENEILETKRLSSELSESLKEKEILIQEVHHRTKNNMQIISSMLSLEHDRITDPSIETEILRKSINRIQTLALAHESMYHSSNIEQINLEQYVEDLIGELWKGMGVTRIKPQLAIDPGITVSFDFAIPLGLIINEIINNTIKHAFPVRKEGTLFIEVSSADSGLALRIGDDGIGIPESVDIESKKTLGFELITALLKQLRGTHRIERNHGTVWELFFPEASLNK